MKSAISLMYHDVVRKGPGDSGFRSPGAAIYKLTEAAFRSHLAAVQACAGPEVDHTANADRWDDKRPVLFTFDDGGVSFLHPIADLLEEFGWRGHFFIATDFIGTAGFLSGADVRELAERGHVVGSHSCSHPLRMSACSREQLLREWSESVARLSDITGTVTTTGSVPGGWFSRAVAEAAAESGLRVLFNSEPEMRIEWVGQMAVLGRYAIQSHTSASECAALASGSRWPVLRQKTMWEMKKVLKQMGGEAYVRVRKLILK